MLNGLLREAKLLQIQTILQVAFAHCKTDIESFLDAPLRRIFSDAKLVMVSWSVSDGAIVIDDETYHLQATPSGLVKVSYVDESAEFSAMGMSASAVRASYFKY